MNEIFESKLVYIDNNDNLGIATALNQACDKAIELQFEWILTMDQDSSFINFLHYKKCLFSVLSLSKVCLLSGNTIRDAIKEYNGNLSLNYEEKFIVITSGNIINLKYFNKIGRFDNKLFIDMVDYDFCAKINKEGLKILYFKDVLIEHALGDLFLRKNLLTGKKKYKREHNPQRVYYITRNSLYLAMKYRKIFPKYFGLLKTINIVLIHDTLKILKYEASKFEKLKAKFLGLLHFLLNKYGSYKL